uniref:Calpain catalytic domain-containing protein n=1 Tax=Fibrocapsa japonica TaxID=94617 RepID=A0A7S2Y1T5_9STRA
MWLDTKGEFVHLRNPWSEFEPGANDDDDGDGVDDGVFRYRMGEFLDTYKFITCSDNETWTKIRNSMNSLGDKPSFAGIEWFLFQFNLKSTKEAVFHFLGRVIDGGKKLAHAPSYCAWCSGYTAF